LDEACLESEVSGRADLDETDARGYRGEFAGV
jgi:hypothetical protein